MKSSTGKGKLPFKIYKISLPHTILNQKSSHLWGRGGRAWLAEQNFSTQQINIYWESKHLVNIYWESKVMEQIYWNIQL